MTELFDVHEAVRENEHLRDEIRRLRIEVDGHKLQAPSPLPSDACIASGTELILLRGIQNAITQWVGFYCGTQRKRPPPQTTDEMVDVLLAIGRGEVPPTEMGQP